MPRDRSSFRTVFQPAVFRWKLDVGQLFTLEQPGACRIPVLAPRDPHDFIKLTLLTRQLVSMGSEDFQANRVSLLNRPAGREAATKIAHIFNEGLLDLLLPLTVDFGDFNRNMCHHSLFYPMFDQMYI